MLNSLLNLSMVFSVSSLVIRSLIEFVSFLGHFSKVVFKLWLNLNFVFSKCGIRGGVIKKCSKKISQKFFKRSSFII